jgi:hypothetical protein
VGVVPPILTTGVHFDRPRLPEERTALLAQLRRLSVTAGVGCRHRADAIRHRQHRRLSSSIACQSGRPTEALTLLHDSDNVRWAPDGTLIATGQRPAAQQGQRGSSHSARIDPKTLKVEELLNRPDDDAFASATVAVQIGQELWIGSVRGDRVAILPVRPGK